MKIDIGGYFYFYFIGLDEITNNSMVMKNIKTSLMLEF